MLQFEQADADGWLTMTTPGRLVMVDQSGEPDLDVDGLWAALASEDIRLVLEQLARGGLSKAPSFALLAWDGDIAAGPVDVRSIIRGDIRVIVETGPESRELSSAGVATWLEQTVGGATGFEASCGAGTAGEGPSLLPIGVGAVRARRVLAGKMAQHAQRPVATEGSSSRASSSQAPPTKPNALPEATVVEPPEPGTTAAQEPPPGYDHLFGATLMRSVEDAAVRLAGEGESESGQGADEQGADEHGAAARSAEDQIIEVSGDHDGLTVFSGDIQKLRAGRVRMPSGQSRAPAAQPAFFLEMSDGTRETLATAVLVGRAPSVTKVSGGEVPKLVVVGNVDQDISRNHVKFTVEGDTVVVTDLHSRNGTMIVLPGKAPQKLRQGEPTSILVGTVVDLGGGVSMTVRAQ